jgi:hypothetical protein
VIDKESYQAATPEAADDTLDAHARLRSGLLELWLCHQRDCKRVVNGKVTAQPMHLFTDPAL